MSSIPKIQKMSLMNMYNLFTKSMVAGMPIRYVVLTYDNPMKNYSRVRADFERLWSLFSYKYPKYDHFCSIDKSSNGCWYINLFVLGSDSKVDNVIHKLLGFWRYGQCMGLPIPSRELIKFLQPFHAIQLGLGLYDQ